MDFKEFFLNLANTVSSKSKDPSTKVGCIIATKENTVKSLGFNGFPHGVLDSEERYANRELKYKLIVHSEMNAICQAAKVGTSLNHCVLYVPWIPCSSCAKAIIQCGIDKVVIDGDSKEYNNVELTKRWEEEFKLTKMMFEESGVELEIYNRNVV